MDDRALEAAVQARFGVSPRPVQRILISRTVARQSSLAIMPTGSGKSLTFQAAAALMDGTVLVVSPLLSLMRDQVEKLKGRLAAARLDATLERDEAGAVLRQLAAAELDLLYVAPERLANERFQSALGQAHVAAVAVDEAHCISAWGHDFRPDYLRLPLLLEALGNPPVLALTATAPAAVQQDIAADLRIPPDGVINTGARRPNLALAVESFMPGGNESADREVRLLQLVTAAPELPTIIYALRQVDTERLAQRLVAAGVRAAPYHAGLDSEVRSSVQDGFLTDDVACIVATIAFGMGVDKPNVRRIIHVHAPRSLEGYFQEVGRAGRDGAPATAVLLYDDADLAALANFVEAKAPDVEQVRTALNLAFAPANRETPDTIAVSPQAVGDAADVDAVAVRTLFAYLERRGIVRALTPAYDEYQIALQHDGDAILAHLGPADGPVWQALLDGGRRGRTWIAVGVAKAVAQTGLPYPDLRRVLRRVDESGLVTIQVSGALQRYRIQRSPDRQTDLPALLQSVETALEGERRRLGAVRTYVLERRCRQGHILAYLGEAGAELCGRCDLCTGSTPLPETALRPWNWREHFDPAVVRSLASLKADGPDAVGVARALCQVSTTRSRPYRRHSAWGQLERAPYREVLEAVRQALCS